MQQTLFENFHEDIYCHRSSLQDFAAFAAEGFYIIGHNPNNYSSY